MTKKELGINIILTILLVIFAGVSLMPCYLTVRGSAWELGESIVSEESFWRLCVLCSAIQMILIWKGRKKVSRALGLILITFNVFFIYETPGFFEKIYSLMHDIFYECTLTKWGYADIIVGVVIMVTNVVSVFVDP